MHCKVSLSRVSFRREWWHVNRTEKNTSFNIPTPIGEDWCWTVQVWNCLGFLRKRISSFSQCSPHWDAEMVWTRADGEPTWREAYRMGYIGWLNQPVTLQPLAQHSLSLSLTRMRQWSLSLTRMRQWSSIKAAPKHISYGQAFQRSIKAAHIRRPNIVVWVIQHQSIF